MSKSRRTLRSEYRREVVLATRWDDNDVFGHLNNTVHYRLFDTVVNGFLIVDCGFDPLTSEVIGLVVESGCCYFSELRFPHAVIAGLRVDHVGNSSVRYEIGLFDGGALEAAAQGYFVHVFVDRLSRRPRPLPPWLRDGLSALQS
jgi:acyl-CoA thioester hydrolase